MSTKASVILLTTVVLSAALTWAQVPTPSSHQHAPMILHQRHGTQASSYNWSGYAVTGANGSVTDVKASWVVPAIQGTCSSTNQYSSFWVGIDGFSDSTVEQIGTDSDCQNGQPTYYAWYEFYPHPSFQINSLKVSPGDVITAEVRYNGNGQFTVSLSVKNGGTFSGSSKVNRAQRSSAEWIAEAPSSGGILPLADFSAVDFGSGYTGVSNTCFATAGGSTGAIGSFGSRVEITMVSQSNTSVVKAQPTTLSSNGTSFAVNWENAGP